MAIGKSLVTWTVVQLARFLSTRIATPVLLLGSLVLAAGGALATTPTQQHTMYILQRVPVSPFPPIICQPDGNGATICRIPANQVALYAVAYSCHQDGRGTDLYVCPLLGK